MASLKGPSKCGVAPSLQWREMVRAEAQRCVSVCEATGMTHWDIAVRVGVHRTVVSLWKHKKADLYAGAFEALKALAAECAAKRRAI